MSSSWELQEDRFDDLDSETDEKLSNYEDDLYIDEHAADEHEKLNEAVVADYVPSKLSTIAEESHVTTEGNEIGARGDTFVDSVFGRSFAKARRLSGENVAPLEESSQFRTGCAEMLQRDQESFFRHKKLAQDDYRFDTPILEKENSWEPSIHFSPPPAPRIHADHLAGLNMTDSHLIPASSPTPTPEGTKNKDVENTPPASSYMQYLKGKNGLEEESGGPKMSTPKSTDTSQRSLRDLSMNCISSIFPETVSPKTTRGMTNLKQRGAGGAVSQKMFTVQEEPSLSSSAIDRVLQRENFDNDDALIDALLQAKARPRFKLRFPEPVSEEQAQANEPHREPEDVQSRNKRATDVSENVSTRKVVTKHDRSGITNKTKKLKTVQELNLLRESSQGSSADRRGLPPILRRNDGSLTPVSEWKVSTNTNTATVSPFPSSTLRHVDAEKQGRYLSCDQSFVYFGFVDVKCRVNRAIRLRNISSKSLNLRLQLHSMSKGYELLEQGIIVLKPEETHIVHIVFEPPFGACFHNLLQIRVLNAEHINYSVPLLGSGGVAALRVLARSGLCMLRDGSFVLTTPGVTNINFDVENKGLRDAFVRVVVLDKETKRAVNGCTVMPSDCVSIVHRTKQRFSIAVPPFSGGEGTNDNSNRSFPVSSWSVPSVVGNAQYYVQLLWGEEAQRRRFKRYENGKKANLTFNGYTFTKCEFVNEVKCKTTASEEAACGFYDREAFELGLRITLISVVDNRLSLMSGSHVPQEHMLAESVILEPNATLSPASSNRSVVEDLSTIFASSRLL